MVISACNSKYFPLRKASLQCIYHWVPFNGCLAWPREIFLLKSLYCPLIPWHGCVAGFKFSRPAAQNFTLITEMAESHRVRCPHRQRMYGLCLYVWDDDAVDNFFSPRRLMCIISHIHSWEFALIWEIWINRVSGKCRLVPWCVCHTLWHSRPSLYTPRLDVGGISMTWRAENGRESPQNSAKKSGGGGGNQAVRSGVGCVAFFAGIFHYIN